MSSHREAPEISKDPVADNTDVYAFVSPDKPDTVTIITNYVPLQSPDAGPNFFEFGDDVLYETYVYNSGGTEPDITYQFRFQTGLRNPNTFLYNTGTITSLTDPNWNRPQTYSVTKVMRHGPTTILATGLTCPPCNIGPFSTPNYGKLADMAVHALPSGETVFAGQRQDGFYADLGAIFDLLDLRPFQSLHVGSMLANAPGINGLKGLNVHSIAIQVPISDLVRRGTSTATLKPGDAAAVIGVYGAASRQSVTIRQRDPDPHHLSARTVNAGKYVQVSRLGNPLFNEVIVPLGKKDLWNALPPKNDDQFVEYAAYPEVSRLVPKLYPGAFPHLDAISNGPTPASRDDIVAILLTGLPSGIIPGFQNYTGPAPMDLLRLNVAIKPASKPSIYGLLGGDLAGFPNGRRVFDDVTTIELRAIAGVTYPLVHPSYTPDGAAGVVTDGVDPSNDDVMYLSSFPYLGLPFSGFDVPSASYTPPQPTA